MLFKTSIDYRKNALLKLLVSIEKHEKEINQALYSDFKKPEFESYLTETYFVLSELKHTIKNINKWAKPKMVLPFLLNFPSTDYLYKEPYGKVLIISPWNYPFHLAMLPMIAAIAAGNQVVLKPSELTPNTSKLISKIVGEVFDKNHVEVIEGGIEVSQNLLAQQWDYIFFTGSVAVGKIVAKAAAEHLTPVTLELGGKNPCIIDEKANLKLASKRIVWGKFINAGQTCIAPDYLLVHELIKEEFTKYLIDEINAAFGENPEASKDLCRIINEKNWTRLIKMLDNQKIIFGGKNSKDDFFISPTIIDEPSLNSLVMQEEIFGPILPILKYSSEDDLDNIILKFEKPLAFYIFTEDKRLSKKLIQKYSFGGGSINDTLIHFSNNRLPFGGVGKSGIGAYHGKFSFEQFSHKKAIIKKANWLDIPIRYAPYRDKIKFLKRILKWL
ncbi:aldehyde dehydrogenase [Flavobacterium capsici]|uniref:Aldehyde dehydrogenase n=1 Tax=Flavobacterium capsici TaxID=3075618 RepID=A0AA96EWR4_9FLAO|nr:MULTISPECIES: aldehyde dehydrogenase [unclassified Flavobacterium]WNM18593.1 aldehyde dehydrogenase [Flavobacterium sp. PMR2A8]WNM22644.1 aldehyde dehydrogenase [Flavobacterium sp. PMTSA4]